MFSITSETISHSSAARSQSCRDQQRERTQRSRLGPVVVVHNAMGQQPADDWTLYPEQTVKHKHSTKRESRKYEKHALAGSNGEKAAFEQMRPTLPPTPPENSPTKSERRAQRKSDFQFDYTDSLKKQIILTRNCHGMSHDDEHRRLLQAPFQRRLPTPDLSDVEGDDLWSCCAETDQAEEATPSK